MNRWNHRSVLARQVAILDIVARSDRLLGLSEIAETLGLPASSTHRLLGVLCEEGLLRRTPWRTYMIGPRLSALVAELATEAASADSSPQD